MSSDKIIELKAGGVMPSASAHATIKVWDLFVRVFHWSLVAAFVVAFLSGEGNDTVHQTSGYVIAGLVMTRIVWGLIGSKYARFSNFVVGPRKVSAFAMQSMRLKAPRHIGHNPAGAVMIIALLATLLGLAITGHLMTTNAYWGSKAMEEVHEGLAYFALGLVLLHVLGVIFTSIEHGENLVKAMITGRKRV
ncbi:cytochrome B561 [Hyphomicrobium denitrificans 1NES1]|uniref:Cytochrome B561 n=1 Tax=Hyphomicrobium denitrificans 1NES1 TaxID=670307 RepID=N0B7P4_9HYPH|nr:cytochrome b/b6 domain-containing protein [Hyphomicrobium denitrificans]AGK56541.1 cytochrome B561 [Hyphomicrobium denitrificans 1NES1]